MMCSSQSPQAVDMWKLGVLTREIVLAYHFLTLFLRCPVSERILGLMEVWADTVPTVQIFSF